MTNQRSSTIRHPLSLDLRGLMRGDVSEAQQARAQLEKVFRGDRDAMAAHYGWAKDAPVRAAF